MSNNPLDDNHDAPKSWFERISQSFQSEPQTKTALMRFLKDAKGRDLLDDDELEMIEGAMKVSTLQARDVMIPKAHMAFIRQGQTIEEFLPVVVNTRHSRFPVLARDNDEVIGILHAKDILKFYLKDSPFVLDHTVLHEVVIVPESKRLDNLLREFQNSHSHMAVVVDEYGAIAGAITIEDIIEEIVGEIEDEFDHAHVDYIKALDNNTFLINAMTPVELFNETFSVQCSDDKVDTMAGVLMQFLGRVPKKNEQFNMVGFEITIVSGTNRAIETFTVRQNDADSD